MHSLRITCGNRVGIATKTSGNEHIFVHSLSPHQSQPSAKPTTYAQKAHQQSPTFPQPKTDLLDLLHNHLSPQSTVPINTITIHIN